jgi:hypothetical protein
MMTKPPNMFGAILAGWCQQKGYPEPQPEFRFHSERKWRFDFAWPTMMVALEIEGGIWNRGGHVRGKIYQDNCVKYSEAAIAGWCVVRMTWEMINAGAVWDFLERAFAASTREI